MILGLTHIHQQGVIHRDIKPENLVLDKNGYVHITDFGISRFWRPDNFEDTSGTPCYMAPEVLCRQNHGMAVDYYALGVILYEFMLGKHPYKGNTRKDYMDSIIRNPVTLTIYDFDFGDQPYSKDAIDFVNGLILRKPIDRLGAKDLNDIKSHSWFNGMNWDQI